jgi:hypothetical protein
MSASDGGKSETVQPAEICPPIPASATAAASARKDTIIRRQGCISLQYVIIAACHIGNSNIILIINVKFRADKSRSSPQKRFRLILFCFSKIFVTKQKKL